MTATVVLVHGAWHGAWCWERFTPRLDAAGIAWRAIDLPGHGADPGRFTDLYGDADRVRAVLDEIAGDVVLVGHSYGGAVITEAGAHPRVRHLVYVAAFALDAGESVMDAATALLPPPASDVPAPGLAEAMEFRPDGTSTLPAAAIASLLYNGCDAETQAWAAARCGPQPMPTFSQPARSCAWREKPSTYVLCTRDLGVPPPLQQALAARCGALATLDADHSPFASAPDALAEVVVALARQA